MFGLVVWFGSVGAYVGCCVVVFVCVVFVVPCVIVLL